jgi:serine protease Do
MAGAPCSLPRRSPAASSSRSSRSSRSSDSPLSSLASRAGWALTLLLAASAAAAAPVKVSQRFQAPGSWAELAEAVKPAVVSIRAVTLEDRVEERAASTDPFEFFFGEPRPDAAPPADAPDGQAPERAEGSGEPRREVWTGSGFLVSADGLVVTNHHVIEGAMRIDVQLGGHTYAAEIVGIDEATDLAVLGIDAGDDLPYLETADSDELRVGDWVMVLGNPLGLDLTVTTGVVSAKGRRIGIASDTGLEDFIQTEAPINFGNSGGPVVDMRGRVVAVATAINYGAQNIGFLVPSNVLEEVLPQLVEYGDVSRGALGAPIAGLSPEQAPAFGVESGVLVMDVPAGSPAAIAEMRRGDVVVAVESAPVGSVGELVRSIAAHLPGSEVTIELVRDGRRLRRTAVLAERPRRDREGAAEEEDAGAEEADYASGDAPLADLEVTDLDAATRTASGFPSDADGALVALVEPLSWLYDQGLRRGHLITEVNGRPISGAGELEQALEQSPAGAYLRFYVLRPRAGSPFYAALQVP